MVHPQGLEPWTHWLRVSCSTNWAKGAHLECIQYYSANPFKLSTCFSQNTICFSINRWMKKLYWKYWTPIAYRCLLCYFENINIYWFFGAGWKSLPAVKVRDPRCPLGCPGWSGEIPEPTVTVRMREENWCCLGVFSARKICVPEMALFCCTHAPWISLSEGFSNFSTNHFKEESNCISDIFTYHL